MNEEPPDLVVTPVQPVEPTYNLEQGWFKKVQSCSHDGYLVKMVNILKKAVLESDWDCIGIIDGTSGSGKSVFALQLAMLFNNIVYVCYTAEKLVETIKKAGKGDVIIFDEGLEGLYSREAMTAITRSLVRLIQEIRQKNLFLLICLPSFYDLDRNIALWRSRFLIHIRVGKQFERGNFDFYNSIKKKQLFLMGKKLYDYKCVRPLFFGRFYGKYPIDKDAYLKMKKESLENFSFDNKPAVGFADRRFQALLCWVKKEYDLTDEQLANGISDFGVRITHDAVRKVRERFKHVLEEKGE